MFKFTFFRITITCVALASALAAGGWKTAIQTVYGVFVDHSAKPVCHKQVDALIRQWQTPRKTREFPNVDGASAVSLALIDPRDDLPGFKSNYNYVPGLTRDDSGDLVLMYVNQPTRWTWHGPEPTIFTEKAWILVPVDMKFYSGRDRGQLGPGEFSERVPFAEFRRRLEKTLKFLEAEKRPHWEDVVKEHSEFLKHAERLGHEALPSVISVPLCFSF